VSEITARALERIGGRNVWRDVRYTSHASVLQRH